MVAANQNYQLYVGPAATPTSVGFMQASDKATLDSLNGRLPPNYITTTLPNGCGAGDTTLTLASTGLFTAEMGTASFRFCIGSGATAEICLCPAGGIVGSTLVGVTRGLESSGAGQVWPANTAVFQVVTPGAVADAVATGTLLLRPLGGGADDSVQINAAMVACAGTGRVVQLLAGLYTTAAALTPPLSTPGTMNKGLTVVLGRGCQIKSTIVDSSQTDNSGSTWYSQASFGANTTLTADGVFGATSVTVGSAAGISIGTWIRLMAPAAGSNAEYAGIYKVLGVAGSVLTLDRPLFQLFPWNTGGGTIVNIVTGRLEGFDLIGYGASIGGTGQRTFEMLAAYRCSLQGVSIDESNGHPTAGGYVASWDVGSHECKYIDVRGVSTGAHTVLTFESSENSLAVDCDVICTGGNGGNCIGFYDTKGCEVIRGVTHGSTNGIKVDTNGASPVIGCVDTRIEGGSHYGHSASGVYIEQATNTKIERVVGRGNANYGLRVGGNARGVSEVGCTWGQNLTAGVLVSASSKGYKAVNIDLDGNGSQGDTVSSEMIISDEFAIDGLTARNCIARRAFVIGTGAVGTVQNARVVGTSATTSQWIFNASGVTRFRNVYITLNTNGSFGILSGAAVGNGAKINLDDVTVDTTGGPTGTTGFFLSSTDTIRIGQGNDFTACAAEASLNGGTLKVDQVGSDTSKAVTAADVTLLLAESQAAGLATTGLLTGNRNLIVPTVAGMAWDVFCNNTGAFTTTFKTAAGSGIVVAQTKRARLKCDGVNVARITADT